VLKLLASVNLDRTICVLPKNTGKGAFWKIRWYYDRNWRVCRKFRFNGKRI